MGLPAAARADRCPPSSVPGLRRRARPARENVLWALAGYVHVFMDTRGQGSGWGTGGDTPDPHGSGPSQPDT